MPFLKAAELGQEREGVGVPMSCRGGCQHYGLIGHGLGKGLGGFLFFDLEPYSEVMNVGRGRFGGQDGSVLDVRNDSQGACPGPVQ